MKDHTTHDLTNEIPYGYCHCGCGSKTNLARQTNTTRGWIKGQPVHFLRGHYARVQDKGKPEDRFWTLVSKLSNNACWQWVGAKINNGYGKFSLAGRFQMAHRFSYELHYGDIPGNMCVLHRCDNRLCVRPDHLFLGTLKENVRDMVAKQRQSRGSNHYSAKLDEASVREIRKRRAESGISHRSLAEEYGVSAPIITRIVNRKIWRHI